MADNFFFTRLSNSNRVDDETAIAFEAIELLSDVQNTLWIRFLSERSISTLLKFDAQSTEVRARTVLLGLGFKQNQLDVKLKTLSGGWHSRCSLASVFLQWPDRVKIV